MGPAGNHYVEKTGKCSSTFSTPNGTTMPLRPLRPFILALLLVPAASSVAAQDYSLEVFAGRTLERSEDWGSSSYDIDEGEALGFAIYLPAARESLSFGVDVFQTRASYSGFPGEFVKSVSVMGVVRREQALSPAISGFVGAGLGMVENTYEAGGTDSSEWVPGGQFSIGAAYALSPRSSMFLEGRYQQGFENNETFSQSYNSTSVLLGYRLNF
jgi:hypothetical protein